MAHNIRFLIALLLLFAPLASQAEAETQGRLAYLVSDLRIPFWQIMARGIRSEAHELGYGIELYSAENSAKKELQNTVEAIESGVDGILLSPTNSSAAVTVLKLAQRASIPVVICDIGSEKGEYVSYIASDNRQGSYDIGKVLVQRLQSLGWDDGSVGIIAIPQTRANGRARTAGFMRALEESGIEGAGIRQQVDFSYQETYDYALELIANNPRLRALWLQGSNRYQAALDAIADADRSGEILLLTFDAEPEFLQLIPKGRVVGAAMQQPFLMGEVAIRTMHKHLRGVEVPKTIELPVLAISAENIERKLPIIKRNVLGLTGK